ncbi:SusC/RagA family TonB-linked outer membrane protein [Bacteroidia bacterium]|nr:SusC/RagA family TonB-linked outer membrane protein [Bacteroidia bacterium]
MIPFTNNSLRTLAAGAALIVLLAGGTGPVQGADIPGDSLSAWRGVDLHEVVRGLLPGVQVTSADGAPGAAASIAVRGIRSVRGDQQPLIVLDGVAMNPSHLQTMNSWSTLEANDCQVAQDLLSRIDIHNIISIEVLSNASATAIWGSQGANGVILIKTRAGVRRAMELQLNSSVGVSTISRKLDFLNPDGYGDYYSQLTGSNPSLQGSGSNWQNKLYSPALTQSHNLSMAGGGGGASYLVSLYYKRHNGIVDGTFSQDLGFSTAIDKSLGRYSSITFNMLFDRSKISMTKSSYLPGSTSTIARIAAAPFTSAADSPVDWREDYDDDNVIWRVVPRGRFKIGFARWVSLNFSGGVDYLSLERLRWLGPRTLMGAAENGRAGVADKNALRYNVDATVDIDRHLGSLHHLTAQAGGHLYGDNRMDNTVQGTDFFNPELRAQGINLAGNLTKMGYGKLRSSNAALSAQAGYTYRDRYRINAGLRGDQLIDYDRGLNYYPFAEAAWDVHKESFLDVEVISKLTLKGGWGISGMDQMVPYFSNQTLTAVDNIADIPWGTQAFYRERLLTRMQEYNLGLSVGFDRDRYQFELRAYSGEGSERLSVYDTRAKGDARRVYVDRAAIDKWGLEASLSATILKNRDQQWLWWGAISMDRSKVSSTGGTQPLGSTGGIGFTGRSAGSGYVCTAFVEGYVPGVFYGYRTDGIVGPQHVSMTPPFGPLHLQPGDVKFVDVNGDGTANDRDRVVIGNPNPKFTFGTGTSFSHHRWTFSARVDGSYGNDVLNLNRLQQSNLNQTDNVLSGAFRNAWSPATPGNKGPAVGGFGMDLISDRMVEDGSYLRLSSLSVAYDLPLKNVGWLRSLGISVSAGNLFVLTPYTGYDPEVDSFSGDWALRGVDLGGYPRVRTFTLGINAKF